MKRYPGERLRAIIKLMKMEWRGTLVDTVIIDDNASISIVFTD